MLQSSSPWTDEPLVAVVRQYLRSAADVQNLLEAAGAGDGAEVVRQLEQLP